MKGLLGKTVELKTRKISEYFSGKIIHNTVMGQNHFELECTSCAGGSIVDAIHIKGETPDDLVFKVREFCKKNNYTFKFIKQ